MIKSINHVAVIVTDVDRAKDFYQRILGLEKIPRPKTRVPGEWLGIGANQLHLIGERAPEGKIDPRRPHMALEVENLEEAKAALTQMGVGFVDPSSARDVIPMDEDTLKLVGEQIWLEDPDGNMIELRQEYKGEARHRFLGLSAGRQISRGETDMVTASPGPSRILEGIRVFDLTIAAVGPWATKLLGAMGADVIKVEAPGGDALSHAVPPKINGTSVLYISANHNKRMIELNLKQEADRAIALELIKRSDVFVNNMRPGAVDRLGLATRPRPSESAHCLYSRMCLRTSRSDGARSRYRSDGAGFQWMVQITGPEHGRGEMFRHLAHIDLTTATVVAQAALQGLWPANATARAS